MFNNLINFLQKLKLGILSLIFSISQLGLSLENNKDKDIIVVVHDRNID